MSDLYPTKTRLGLLADIANGQVVNDVTRDDDVIWLYPYAPTEWQTRHKVTADVREQEHAGWIEEDRTGVFWRLTKAGRTVLDASRPPRPVETNIPVGGVL